MEKLKDNREATWAIGKDRHQVGSLAWLLNVDRTTVHNRIDREELRAHRNPGDVYVQTALSN